MYKCFMVVDGIQETKLRSIGRSKKLSQGDAMKGSTEELETTYYCWKLGRGRTREERL